MNLVLADGFGLLMRFCFRAPLENFDSRGAMFPLAFVPKFSPVIVTSGVFQRRVATWLYAGLKCKGLDKIITMGFWGTWWYDC